MWEQALKGTETRTTSGVVGVSGRPLRLYEVAVTPSELKSPGIQFHNGTTNNNLVATVYAVPTNNGSTIEDLGGMLFTQGCYMYLPAYVTVVSVNIAVEAK